jgi:tripartite-type tricarboxylate transporter receptor subunit TctC
MRKHRLVPGLVLGAGLALATLAQAALTNARAQTFPDHPVTMVVPYPAGGVTDTMARLLADRMQAALGQPVVIEDLGGGAGSIALGRVARAAPDGYTIALGNVETNVLNAVSQKLGFDPIADFEPITMVPSYPFLIVSKNDVPARTLPEFLDWLRAHQSTALQGIVGAGSIQQLCGARMQKILGMKWTFVPYRGGAQALQDMLAGRFDFMCTATGSFLPQVQAGAIRAYAVTSAAPMEGAPEIPTVDQAGMLKGFHVSVWNALFAPKGTPRAAIDKIHDAAIAALKDPEFRKRVVSLGLDMPSNDYLTPETLAAFHRSEADVWWPLMKDLGIVAQ